MSKKDKRPSFSFSNEIRLDIWKKSTFSTSSREESNTNISSTYDTVYKGHASNYEGNL